MKGRTAGGGGEGIQIQNTQKPGRNGHFELLPEFEAKATHSAGQGRGQAFPLTQGVPAAAQPARRAGCEERSLDSRARVCARCPEGTERPRLPAEPPGCQSIANRRDCRNEGKKEAAPGARPGGAGRGRTGRDTARPAPWGRPAGGGSAVAFTGAQLPARRRALCSRTPRCCCCLRPHAHTERHGHSPTPAVPIRLPLPVLPAPLGRALRARPPILGGRPGACVPQRSLPGPAGHGPPCPACWRPAGADSMGTGGRMRLSRVCCVFYQLCVLSSGLAAGKYEPSAGRGGCRLLTVAGPCPLFSALTDVTVPHSRSALGEGVPCRAAPCPAAAARARGSASVCRGCRFLTAALSSRQSCSL